MDGFFPRMQHVRQEFPPSTPVDVAAALAPIGRLPIKPGARIAVAVGSRGVDRIGEVVAGVVERLRAAGAVPFIVPAMGSHGGATPEGQTEVLAAYGVSETRLGVPVDAGMDVVLLGTTPHGVPAHLATSAARSDGIIVVNRIKPHTDFTGAVESGLLKMIAIGLGKREGATHLHRAAARTPFAQVIRSVAATKLRSAPFLAGIGLVEDQRHQLCRLAVLRVEEIESGEQVLLEEARRLMPRLPLPEIDLLIVDYLGKNISGAGMDPNVIGRDSYGYSTRLAQAPRPGMALIHRIFVRDLTPETHGNGIGVGLADFTTTRLVRGIDTSKMYVNSLTSLALSGAKIPLHFETDREALAAALPTCALPDPRDIKVVRIRDTLSLGDLQVSEACRPLLEGRADLTFVGAAAEMAFDGAGNLLPLVGPLSLSPGRVLG